MLSLHDGQIQARNNDLDPAGTFTVDGLVAEASVDDYDALLLPGGTVNPDKLRVDQAAVGFVKDFVGSGKPVGVNLPRAVDAAGSRRGVRSYPDPLPRASVATCGTPVPPLSTRTSLPMEISSRAGPPTTCPRSALRL